MTQTRGGGVKEGWGLYMGVGEYGCPCVLKVGVTYSFRRR